MTQHHDSSFDDPPLKQHCCAVWSCECAPQALRDRLAALLAEESIPRNIKPPAAFWQRPFAGVAAAAVVLLVSGVVLLQGSSRTAEAAAIDPQFAADLVFRHDDCCQAHNNHQIPGVPKSDMTKLGQVLSENLHAPVMVASLPESGWSFRGGSICPVGKAATSAGHLIFDHGKSSVSVFSLPRSAYAQNGRYEAVVDHHAIAGFADSRGTFCLVASKDSRITPEHLAALRDRMQADVVSSDDGAARVTVAELLH